MNNILTYSCSIFN